MAKDFAKSFYRSGRWKHTRDSYAKYVGGICEICWSKGKVVPGEIVHHKIHLTESNINNPEISLSFSNLQLVCRDCHAIIHAEKETGRRYKIRADGSVVV